MSSSLEEQNNEKPKFGVNVNKREGLNLMISCNLSKEKGFRLMAAKEMRKNAF